MVLGTLVVTTTSLSLLVRQAATRAVASKANANGELLTDVLRAADAPIQQWLTQDSQRAVLPPNATEPRIDVLNDTITLTEDGPTIDLTIRAWDQQGMVPLDAILNGAPLRLAAPPEIREQVDDADLPDRHLPGLDLLRGTLPAFPQPDTPSIGATIATHNPITTPGRQRLAARINVATAPKPLLEAALRAASRSGIEVILDARRNGQPVPLGDLPQLGEQRQNAPRLVGVSSCWSFRIDAAISSSGQRRAWWAIYANQGGEWSLVQRLVIDD